MSRFRIVLIILCVLVLPVSLAYGAPSNARQLVNTAESALEGVAGALEDPATGFRRGDTEDVVFLANLSAMRARLDLIRAALSARDERLFDLLDLGSADLGALRVSWARTGNGNERIDQGLRIASSSYRMLRANYGREGLRHRQGGGLSEAEKRQFLRLQRSQRRLAESLRTLRDQSRRRGDETTAAEMERLRLEAERIARASLDLAAYLNSLIAVSEVRGEWAANARYVRQTTEPEDYVVANETVEDLYVDSDIGHVFTVDLGSVGGWSYADEETEVPVETQAGAVVEILLPGEGEEAVGEPEVVEIIQGPVAEPVFSEEPAVEPIFQEEEQEEREPAEIEETIPEEEPVAERPEEISVEDLPIEEPGA
ncbi:MAG TPA: hypothetical protein VLE27_03460, partial [Thermoanaerobaculia bacterium]|nr:hypothetical protein [Thermoanaerobaculia bacterium]